LINIITSTHHRCSIINHCGILVKKDMVFTKLPSATLRSRIAAQIRDAILSGTLREGDRLVERTLAAELGSSVTSVREAMIELEAEGFLTKKPNSATHVTRLTRSDVAKIFDVRRVLEAYAVEEACRKATPEQALQLELVYSGMVRCVQENNGKGLVNRDVEFHKLIWEFTGNEFLQLALKRAVLPYFAFVSIRVSGRTIDPFRDAYSHKALVDVIKSNDVDGARKAFEQSFGSWFSSESGKFDDAPTFSTPSGSTSAEEADHLVIRY
jgi:DNA-binding GntR family transcriptional regulator